MAKSAKSQGLNGDPRRDGASQAWREDILKVLSIRFEFKAQEFEAGREAALKKLVDDEGMKAISSWRNRVRP